MKSYKLSYTCNKCHYHWKSKKPLGFDPAKCPRCNSKNIKRDIFSTSLEWLL